ncbi:MAG: hypothetical protein ACI8T1_001446 [Verrucomicrobiales bacterium]|jgi:hypothetical protein
MNISRWLSNPFNLTFWCVAASFGTYACMYGFRKPFTASSYETDPFEPGIKASLVGAQVLGYMFSKFIGIKVISEMPAERRAIVLLGLIGVAQIALVLFGLVPPPYNMACLFMNGIPLGMVYGLVLGFLEGRKLTEAFVAGLCASFIFASGFVKSVGAWLLEKGVTESWMPATAGMIFLFPLCVFVWMLTQIPVPTEEDIEARAPREPMTNAERWLWIRRHGVGLACIITGFLMITVLRSLRDDFAPELWKDLGTTGEPSVFARSELLVALGVTLASALVIYVKDNRRALLTSIFMGIGGFAIAGLSMVGLKNGMLSGFQFMVIFGFGLYLPYVIVHTTVFERLIAMTRDKGNMGYLMYLADATGYLAYVILVFFGDIFKPESSFLANFVAISWWVVVIGVLSFLGAAITYGRRQATPTN